MFVTAATHTLDLSPIWQAFAISRALIRAAYAVKLGCHNRSCVWPSDLGLIDAADIS